MFHNFREFLATLEGVRKRTLNYALEFPDDRAGWAPVEGKFTTGDLIRHLGSAEAMFSRVIAGGPWSYDGHDQDKGATLKEALSFLDRQHQAAISTFRDLPDAVLSEKRLTLQGFEVKAGRLLFSMLEHEIHHRGQLAVYLQLAGRQPPQIYGLKVEEVPRVKP